MSSTPSTRRAQIPELPRELVVAIARAGERGRLSSRVLAVMPQVCNAWRTAIAAESASLWRSAALADFPQLQRIVEISGLQQPCFRSLYQKQLRALPTQLHPPRPAASFSDYVLTIELDVHAPWAKVRFPSTSTSRLYAEAEVQQGQKITVARSSERLDRVLGVLPLAEDGYLHGTTRLTKDPAYDELIPGDATAYDLAQCILLRFSLTRLADMNAVELCDFPDCDHDDGQITFNQVKMPCIPHLFPTLQRTPDPFMSAVFCPSDGMEVDFQAWEVPGPAVNREQEEQEMTLDEFKTYLTWHAPWPEEQTT